MSSSEIPFINNKNEKNQSINDINENININNINNTLNNSESNPNKIIEYEKMFQHCEKMYNYYKNKNDKKQYKKRIDYYIINIHFFCAELLAFFDLEKTNFQFYFDKMKYYLNLNEEN